jgi:pSer/pThr/pTyr-binding forkhead associated (FHA) protein
MSLTLQILTGHRNGETLHLEKTTTLGREAEISFNDAKMSKIHAILEFDPTIGWVLRDSGSKNGVHVNDLKTEQHLLGTGDIIDIGTTQIRVATVSASWKPLLNQLLLDVLDRSKNEPINLVPFRSFPTLCIVQGQQAGEKYLFEYGPRAVGGNSYDVILFEPHCPDIAFVISPSTQGALFETKYPQIVKMNGAAEHKKILKDSDQISIHNTVIDIHFVNT